MRSATTLCSALQAGWGGWGVQLQGVESGSFEAPGGGEAIRTGGHERVSLLLATQNALSPAVPASPPLSLHPDAIAQAWATIGRAC